MASDTKRHITPPPTIDDVYSGSPSRLAKEAVQVKSLLNSSRTLPSKQKRRSTLRLPPDTTPQAFQDAIKALRGDIGDENVVVNDKEHLEDGWYIEHPNTHDAFHIVEHDELVASALVYPGSTAEVQKVVRWANKYTIPIYPISIGRNLGYGGAAPRVPGGVVLDLGKRMHQILSIDAENASCLVEPGVTYFKLYEEIEKRGLPLWIDTPDLGGGSVLGNAIDRGVGYTPYGDHFAQHCGMELVLPNGEILRTGMYVLFQRGKPQSGCKCTDKTLVGVRCQAQREKTTHLGSHFSTHMAHQSMESSHRATLGS